MKPVIIITRPEADARDAADDIAALGYQTLCQPLMTIGAFAWQPPDWQQISAIIITSGNAVAYLDACDKTKPVFAVGTRTADKLRAAGFSLIAGAVERSSELPVLITPYVKPEAGILLHLTSHYVRDDFYMTLKAAGYTLDQCFVYKADAVEHFSYETCAALKNSQKKLVLFYSPRSARLFQELMIKHNIIPQPLDIQALCFSAAVADSCGKDVFGRILTASSPTHAAMLRILAEGVTE